MRTKILVSIVAVLLCACSDNNTGAGSNAQGDGGESSNIANGDDPHAFCAAYLGCVAVAAPPELAADTQAYGPNGTCWSGGDQMATDCGNACLQAMETLSTQFRDLVACGYTPPSPPAKPVDAGAVAAPEFPGFDASCNECANTSCGHDLNTCLSSSDCVSDVVCASACCGKPSTCLVGCVSDSGTIASSGSGDAMDFVDCLQRSCGDQCPGYGNK